jgi:hypothetical protein
MASFTFTIPDAYSQATLDALREQLGEGSAGLTAGQVRQRAGSRWIQSIVRSYQRRNAAGVSSAVSAAETARASAATAAATAEAARISAEDTEDAAVVAAFGG